MRMVITKKSNQNKQIMIPLRMKLNMTVLKMKRKYWKLKATRKLMMKISMMRQELMILTLRKMMMKALAQILCMEMLNMRNMMMLNMRNMVTLNMRKVLMNHREKGPS